MYQIISIQWDYVEADRLYTQAVNTYVSTDESNSLTVDLASLKAINPEVVGWLQINNTDISYPVVQGPDNDKYLRMAYDGSASRSGSIFMNAYNTPDFNDANTLIYGHHMRDQSMFGKLMYFEDPAYLDQHRTFTICTENGNVIYQIFAAYVTYSASFVYTDHFEFSWDFYDFIEKSLASSILNMGVEVTTEDKIVTLSTCTSRGNRAERFVVQGKRITP